MFSRGYEQLNSTALSTIDNNPDDNVIDLSNTGQVLYSNPPNTDSSVTNKLYVDQLNATKMNIDVPLNQITIPNGDVSMNSHKITNLAYGVNNTDAITKQQLDTGLNIK